MWLQYAAQQVKRWVQRKRERLNAMYQTIQLPAVRPFARPADRAARKPRTQQVAKSDTRQAGINLFGLIAVSVVVVTSVLTVTMALIHAQPYANPDVRAIVSDPTCDSPCWAGIVPGVTSASEAIAILEAHPWIDQVQESVGKISFWWNGQQPAILDDTGRAFHGRLEIRLIEGIERVASIVLATRAAFGDVQLELGQPDALTLYAIAGDDDTRAGVVHVGEYVARGISIFNLLNCPLEVTDFWHAATFIAFGEPTLAFEGEKIENDTYKLPDGFFAGRPPYCG